MRANAASLLLDAFPLQDPDSTRDKIDEIMQKQFDIMMVRAVSRILLLGAKNVKYLFSGLVDSVGDLGVSFS